MSNVPSPPTGRLNSVAAEVQGDAESAGGSEVPIDLGRRTARGAVVTFAGQASTLVVRTGSMVVLARLLLPEHFGLVGMVVAVTGFLGLFRDCGLSMATIQRATITDAQTSTLFWINLVVGIGLAAVTACFAPALAAFYQEPRLLWVTLVSALSFILYGASAQHRAILQRRMRFTTLAIVDAVALVVSVMVGVGMAAAGQGYWSLVWMTVAQPGVNLLGVWLAARWVPGKPRRGCGVRSMLWYGSTLTLNGIVVYVAYNFDKILLGRFCGAEALGIYGRAYQLISLPTENLNSTIGMVAFPALSRIQNDPDRLRRYFLRGYRFFLSLVMPITVGCALFSTDIISVFLGDKWHDAARIFRLMAPTILAFALINPFGWMMFASGHAVRSLKIAFLIAPTVILGYVLGLKGGPEGVAMCFSIAMVLLVPAVIAWAKHGTLISTRDIFYSIAPASVSVILGALAVVAMGDLVGRIERTFPRLVVESSILFGVYALALLFVMGQRTVFADLLRDAGFVRGGRGSQATK